MINLDIQKPLCRLLLCKGTTCGTNNELPTEFLEDTWKQEELHGVIGMKISTCQDACEHANVARVIIEGKSEWFGNLKREDYEALLAWARACRNANQLIDRPASLMQKRFTFVPKTH